MRHTILVLIVALIVAVCDDFTNAENVQTVDNRRLRISADVEEERGFDALSKLVPNLMGGDDALAKLSKIFVKPDSRFHIADDEVAKMSVLVKKVNADYGLTMADDEVAKFAKTFAVAKQTAQLTDDQVIMLTKGIADAKKAKEAATVSNEEVAKVSEVFKNANAGATGGAKFTDDELVKIGKGFAVAQKEAGLSEIQVTRLAKLFAAAKQATTTSDESVAKLSQELAVVAQKDKKSWSTLKKVIVGTLGVTVGGAVIYGTVKLTTKDSATVAPATSTSSSEA
ncbi:Secreted RxLR effector peptide protein [Phytophthora palmivora]|uniref:Secreted RxLR effector peptide protein n=1 Tax=Phytophthora palmivora TaxID=4796 RepID=A0A2P4WXG9_9STRA|nr:Secreted RxLR effector peptide protein [Phytophthora palmivora]